MSSMLRVAVLFLALCCQVVAGAGSDKVVKQVLRMGPEEWERLPVVKLGRPNGYQLGFEQDGAEYICHNTAADEHRGVCWQISMESMPMESIILHGQALAEAVLGAPGSNFSLYVDTTYMDGSHKWGSIMSFDPKNTGEWQSVYLTLIPDKPVRTHICYLLLRNCTGKVRFRGLQGYRLSGERWTTFDHNQVLQVEPPSKGFLIRDVAAGSDFVALEDQALGVKLEHKEQRLPSGAQSIMVKLSNSAGQGDRALTLVYTIPLPEGSLRWHHDPGHSRGLDGEQLEVMNSAVIEAGSNCLLSYYPFGAVSVAGQGVALGLDPATPLFYRIGCQAGSRELYLACDIGLAAEKPSATFNLIIYNFPAEHGFRGALEGYYKLYPEAFRVRIREHGVWMPFARISAVEGWEDFGFRFKEGDNEIKWDDEHGMLTFRYTEPMTWWMSLKSEDMSYDQGVAEARRLAESGNAMGKMWQSSVFEDEDGTPPGRVMLTPWCNGVVWSINSAPGVAGEVTDYKQKFGPEYMKRYDNTAGGDLDGEYVDSAEAYVTQTINYRRDHFGGMERPLCYSHRSHKVGIYKGMIGFEYVRGVCDEMRRRGKYTMANSTPINWFWLAPLLDIMGTETNWKPGDRWSPMSYKDLLYRRALCGGKPYCFLMNTNFDNFSYEDSERFMQRSLAFGFFPGYFSADASTKHYFKNPELYNRDRPLFKRYIPICRRLSESGWQPLTGARVERERIWVERFGSVDGGRFYLTLFNDTESEQRFDLELTVVDPQHFKCSELIEGQEVRWSGRQGSFELGAQRLLVLEFEARQ